MKKILAVTALTCVIVVAGACILMAGALDRQNVQPRTNSVTQGMIRVPGVVGMDQMSAMAAIQQAGLNVSVQKAKKVPKDMKGAENMEGRVISQVPGPGGMAMYGTTVTIYLVKPKPVDAAGAADSTGWGSTGMTTPSYTGTGSYPYPATDTTMQQTGQQYYPPAGSTGMPAQSTQQPFQVQQYYYPPAQGAPQDPSAQQPVDPYAGQPMQDPGQPVVLDPAAGVPPAQ
ncbi:MAG TPA: PASTA domain-containing protein [Deltaproteobacteria bacterium]|jgi:hypothetical protein|nr:PASTA domain-containing protein [Deltaproteobacteria bacterium]HOI06019.1 PASTA domain-containing protein [Deltaproteobacteria bacterium]